MKRLAFSLFLFAAGPAAADIVSDNNKSADPPLFSSSETGCTAELLFKAVYDWPPPFGDDNHGYVVVAGEDGRELELRGGTEKRGPGGNPFSCPDTGHDWGVVAPYVGKHGKLAEGVYSPDGNVANLSGRTTLGPGAQPNICALANCVMTVMKALGQSCKKYILGTAQMRNSNTILSQALASCGVPDGRPSGLTASGWGANWE